MDQPQMPLATVLSPLYMHATDQAKGRRTSKAFTFAIKSFLGFDVHQHVLHRSPGLQLSIMGTPLGSSYEIAGVYRSFCFGRCLGNGTLRTGGLAC